MDLKENNKVTFEQICKANELISTTNIKGKEYAEVNQRIKAFRSVYPNGSIQTDLLSNDNGVCIFKAIVLDENNYCLGMGTAYEKEDSSYINKTSYIENCETSAVGRALGMCGFGTDTSVASYEEVANAINNQEKNANKEAESQRNYKLEIQSYASILAEKKGKTKEEWIDEAKKKYKTEKGVADCLFNWSQKAINNG